MYASNYPVVNLYSSFEDHLNCVREYFNDDLDIFSKMLKNYIKLIVHNFLHPLLNYVQKKQNIIKSYMRIHSRVLIK